MPSSAKAGRFTGSVVEPVTINDGDGHVVEFASSVLRHGDVCRMAVTEAA